MGCAALVLIGFPPRTLTARPEIYYILGVQLWGFVRRTVVWARGVAGAGEAVGCIQALGITMVHQIFDDIGCR